MSDEVAHFFPPTPNDKPAFDARRNLLGPPKEPRITDQDVAHMPTAELTERVLRCRDLPHRMFGVLEFAQELSFAHINARRRALMKRVHPDKNTAPGATEALKAVHDAHVLLAAEIRVAQSMRTGLD